MDVKDCNGAKLADGDSVQLIKDLKVKGSSVTLKRGTIVKSIRLTGDPGEIEGNGIDDDGNGYVDDVHGIDARLGTGNPLDLALEGEGFLEVEGPNGPLYTRNGKLRLDPQGNLTIVATGLHPLP